MHDHSPQPIHRLSDRDRRIVEHVGRYRLTTFEVLRRTVVPGVSVGALSKVTRRLCRLDLLQRFSLLHPQCYFVLGTVGAGLLGLGVQRTTPLGPQSLPLEYAVLVYATLGRQPRRRLTRKELQSHCPWLLAPFDEAPHCIDEQQTIELLRIDLGGPADHVARKAAREIRQRRQVPYFDRFVHERRFRLVVITGTREKSATIRQSLDRHDWPRGLAIHLSVVPQLLSITASPPHA
jgi:hypothetical protein